MDYKSTLKIDIEDLCPLKTEQLYIQYHHHSPPAYKSSYTLVDLPSAIRSLYGLAVPCTWYFLTSPFCLDECLNYLLNFTFLKSHSDTFTGFVVGHTDC